MATTPKLAMMTDSVAITIDGRRAERSVGHQVFVAIGPVARRGLES